MRRTVALLALLLASPLLAYSAPTFFPSAVTGDSIGATQFGVLQASPDTYRGRSVLLGGKIVGTEVTEKGTLILVKHLPIVERPMYGPVETLEVTGERFAILYPGKVDEEGLWLGNKLLVVAVVQGNSAVTFPDGISRTQPYVVARCMHVWKTGEYGSYQIFDFPYLTDSYYPLPQETYCAKP